MKEFWNDRYSEADFVYGRTSNSFLQLASKYIPRGNILCLAEGEGRNAVYLASLGYTVTAVDQSKVGLKKAEKLSDEMGVELTLIEADLRDFKIEPNHWQGIVSIFAHLPTDLRKTIHKQVKRGLATDGIFIMEQYSPEHANLPGIGGPPPENTSLFGNLIDIQTELEGLSIVFAQEAKRFINEGKYHQGWSGVIQIIAQA